MNPYISCIISWLIKPDCFEKNKKIHCVSVPQYDWIPKHYLPFFLSPLHQSYDSFHFISSADFHNILTRFLNAYPNTMKYLDIRGWMNVKKSILNSKRIKLWMGMSFIGAIILDNFIFLWFLKIHCFKASKWSAWTTVYSVSFQLSLY